MNQANEIVRNLISNLEFFIPRDISAIERISDHTISIVYGGEYSDYKIPSSKIDIYIDRVKEDCIYGVITIKSISSYHRISGTICEENFQVNSLSELLNEINQNIKKFEIKRLEHIERQFNTEREYLKNFVEFSNSIISFAPEESISKESLKTSAYFSLQKVGKQNDKFVFDFINVYGKCLDDFEISNKFLNSLKESKDFINDYKVNGRKSKKEFLSEHLQIINRDALLVFFREISKEFILNNNILEAIGPVAAELLWKDVDWRVRKEHNRFVCKLENATTTKVTKFKRLNYVEKLEINSHVSIDKSRIVEVVRCINCRESKVYREANTFDSYVSRGLIDYHPSRSGF